MNAPKPKRPATKPARALKAKLEALAAAPGTAEEGAAARKKLDRLNARYDWRLPDVTKEGLFAGHFCPAPGLRHVLTCPDWSLANFPKWALEESTGIRCQYQGNDLMAAATPDTAAKLARIGATIAEGFTALWMQFATFPTVNHADRPLFWRGLYDGMMNQPRPAGEPLPARAIPLSRGRAKKNAVGHLAGVGLHPYSVALDLGRSMAFSVPLVEVSKQLAELKPKQLGGK